jgi:Do/DeqQ family serine protease
MRNSNLKWPLGAILLVVGFVLGVAATGDDEATVPALAVDSAVAAPVLEPPSFADVAAAAMPGVVNISTDKVVEMPSWHPMLEDPFFRRFFGEPEGRDRERVERSLGSGVIVSEDGYILTSNHVIERASKIRVLLNGNKEYEAEIIGQDEQTDVALIKVDVDEPLPVVRIGDSRGLRIGDRVMAIGNPFGVGQTVTLGIVSALGRSIGLMQYEDFIQTDAAINPGNSGGALVNMDGELVGINTAILSRSGGSQGVGFAIPSHMAETIMGMLIADGRVKRAWLGVSVGEVDQTMADALGMDHPRGVLVAEVNPDTPAEKAGLAESDVILSVDGKEVNSISELRNTISLAGVGTEVGLKVLHESREREVEVKLAEMPQDLTASRRTEGEEDSDEGLEGVVVRELSDRLRQQLDLGEDMEGVVVTDVDRTSNAWNRGLREGDVIVEIARERVRDLDDYRRLIDKDKDRPVLLKIKRGDQTPLIAVPR